MDTKPVNPRWKVGVKVLDPITKETMMVSFVPARKEPIDVPPMNTEREERAGESV